MEFETIKFDTSQEGVGLITLNRPERLNAINPDMLDDFFALFDYLNKNEDIRVIIITGEGRGFCSGADLTDDRVSTQAADFFTNAATHLIRIQKVYSRLIVEMNGRGQPDEIDLVSPPIQDLDRPNIRPDWDRKYALCHRIGGRAVWYGLEEKNNMEHLVSISIHFNEN